MIGTRHALDDKIQWGSAALSNLSFNTPGCIVGLVTDKEKLEALELKIKEIEEKGWLWSDIGK